MNSGYTIYHFVVSDVTVVSLETEVDFFNSWQLTLLR